MPSDVEMKNMAVAEWMPRSLKPELKDWLQTSQETNDKNRLLLVGNIVMPPMAFFAMCSLSRMWQP